MKIAFYKGRKTLFSHAIYFFQRYIKRLEKKHAIYTHCELFFDNKVMYGSSEHDDGVRGRYMPKFKDRWDFVEIKISKDEIDHIFTWCELKDGNKYDILGIVFAQALNTNWLLRPDKWFCSEFVVAALQKINYKKTRGISAHMISPGQLHKLLT